MKNGVKARFIFLLARSLTLLGLPVFVTLAADAEVSQSNYCYQSILIRLDHVKVYFDQSPHDYRVISVLQPNTSDKWPHQGPGELDSLVARLKSNALHQCANGIILQGFPVEGETSGKKAIFIFEERLEIEIIHN